MARVPPNARLVCAAMFGLGLFLIVVNHFTAGSKNVIYLGALFFGPLATFLGIGGMIEPKIVWSIGKYGKHLPVTYKLIGVALALTGVAVSAILAFVVYRLQDVAGPRP